MHPTHFKYFRNSLLVLLFIIFFTFLLNVAQIVCIGMSINKQVEAFRSSNDQEVRLQSLVNTKSDLNNLSHSINTPWLKLLASFLVDGKDLDNLSDALRYSSRIVNKSAPVLAELSLLKEKEVWIESIDRNRSALAISSFDIARLFNSLDSIAWEKIPTFRQQFEKFDTTLTLLNKAWGRNYQSIGVWSELLGAKEPQRYFVALQNSAQARGTGGMPGTFAIVEIEKGQIRIIRTGTNAELRSASRVPIRVPKEFFEIYGNYPSGWNPSNLSPHFPYAAKIWLALWKAQTGESLDGAIAVDPNVLASLLEATGNIEVDGTVLTPDNTVDELLSKSYKRYQYDNAKRKNYLAEVAKVFGLELQENSPSPLALGKALLKPVSENRVLIYSSDASKQEVIENSAISGSINFRSKNDFRAIVLNTSGNKMDYYLERKLSIKSVSCSPNVTELIFTLRLNVEPDARLPDYVNGRKDLGMVGGLGNSHGVAVLIFGPKNSTILPQDSDLPKSYLSELGRPVWLKYADLKPKVDQSFKVVFSGGAGKVTTSVQPLVRAQETEIFEGCAK